MKKITKISYLITTNVDFFDFNKNNIQKKNETKRLSNEVDLRTNFLLFWLNLLI
ncbi:MAG: hypothetical protein PHQ70_08585 [Arcobacter sp.]|nr:hypothetical protein [Arcobacter sp.]